MWGACSPSSSPTTLLLSAADHWTTYLCLRSPVQGFEVTEANPLAAWLFSNLGLVEGLLLDSVVTVLASPSWSSPSVSRRGEERLPRDGGGVDRRGVINNLGAIEALSLSPLG